MNDNDIIKGLLCCVSSKCTPKECPYYDFEDCSKKNTYDIIDLINRQKAKIEKLSKENLTLKDGYFQKRYEEDEHIELLAVREAWRKAGMDYIDLNAEWEGKYKTAKAEAIKEFAERLKNNIDLYRYVEEHYINAEFYCKVRQDLFNDKIDTLVKEMTEGRNEHH